MSWLGSLVGPLQPFSGGGDGVVEFSGEAYEETVSSSDARGGEEGEPIEQGSPSERVKEDIRGFSKSLSSKLWGVASFLSPPSSSHSPSSSSSSPSLRCQQNEQTISGDSELVVPYESLRTSGIRSDLAEIGGTLKTGIARLSNNVAINGISKIAYNIISLREDEEDEVEIEEEYEDERFIDVIGVTDEVLAFAGNIACHPETWLDFPLLSDNEALFDDFDMSEAQQHHALAIESLVQRLAALRIELCPTHMSTRCFWKIYFTLLHPRLNKHDADLLSTPQIVEARAMLQHGLQSQAKQASENFRVHLAFKDEDDGGSTFPDQLNTPGMLRKYWSSQGAMASSSFKEHGAEKHSVLTSDTEFVDKFVVQEEPLRKKVKELVLHNLSEEEDDVWPEDDTQDLNLAGTTTVLACNEEDISFSDLEDGGECSSFSKFSISPALI